MISNPISRELAGPLSALREDYQPKRVTFANLSLEEQGQSPISPKQSLSSFISAKPFFPRDHISNWYSPPETGPGPDKFCVESDRGAELSALRRLLREETRQREALLEELESLKTENLSLREAKSAAEKEVPPESPPVPL